MLDQTQWPNTCVKVKTISRLLFQECKMKKSNWKQSRKTNYELRKFKLNLILNSKKIFGVATGIEDKPSGSKTITKV